MDRFLPQCYPCALRRALCTAEKVSDDEWLQHKVIDEAMRQLAEVEVDVMFVLAGGRNGRRGLVYVIRQDPSFWRSVRRHTAA